MKEELVSLNSSLLDVVNDDEHTMPDIEELERRLELSSVAAPTPDCWGVLIVRE